MNQYQISMAKDDLKELVGCCETCGKETTDLLVTYDGRPGEPFDPDLAICRCRGCHRWGKSEPVRRAHWNAA